MRLAEARAPIRAYPSTSCCAGQLVRQQMWSPVAHFASQPPARLASNTTPRSFYTAEIDTFQLQLRGVIIFGSECISVQPLRTPKSSTGQTSTRPARTSGHLRCPAANARTVVRREMTSSSSVLRAGPMAPSIVALVARSMIDAVLLPDRPAVRNTSGVTASTAWGVTLPPIAWTNRPWIGLCGTSRQLLEQDGLGK